jgi:starch synthase
MQLAPLHLGLPESYKQHFRLNDPEGGEGMNIMQAGLKLATKVIAVSAGYAWEIATDTGGCGQGLTLVHFSAQPEPFLTQTHTLNGP